MRDKRFSPSLVTVILLFQFVFLIISLKPVAQVTNPEYGGILIESVYSDAQLFNPVISSDRSSGKIENLLFEELFAFDKDRNVHPQLASRWDISLDKLDYTFYLREGVFWHDGEKFKADDIIFTLDRLLDPETDTALRSHFTETLDVNNTPYTRIDEYTFSIHFAEISLTPFQDLHFSIIPQHVYANYLGPDGIAFTADDCRDPDGTYTFNDDPINTASEGKIPIGTGPMMFKEWEVHNHITLIRNSQENGGPGYWDEHDAYVERYIMQINADLFSQVLALQRGEISMMDLSSIPRDQIEQLLDHPNVTVYTQHVPISKQIMFQCDPGKGHLYGQESRNFEENPNYLAGFAWQADQYPELNITGHLVRQALNYGLNKTKFMDEIAPLESRCVSPVYPAQVEWYNDQVNPYPYNLSKANELLDHAGYGAHETDPRRKELNFTLSVNWGSLYTTVVTDFAKTQWEQLGITVTTEFLEWSYMLPNYYNHRNFDAMVSGISGSSTALPNLFPLWHSRNIRPESQPIAINSSGQWVWDAEGDFGGQNCMSYWNPAVNTLMETAQNVTERDTFKAYYDQIQELIVEDAPFIWLFSYNNHYGVNNNFKGFVDGAPRDLELWPAPVGFHNIYYEAPAPETTSSSGDQTSSTTSFEPLQFDWARISLNILLLSMLGVELYVLWKIVGHVMSNSKK